jgi:hypothetical protein
MSTPRVSSDIQEFTEDQDPLEEMQEEDYDYEDLMADYEEFPREEDIAREEDVNDTYCAFGICVDTQRMFAIHGSNTVHGSDAILQMCAPCLRGRDQDPNVCNDAVDWLTEKSASMTCKTFLEAVHAKIDMNYKK